MSNQVLKAVIAALACALAAGCVSFPESGSRMPSPPPPATTGPSETPGTGSGSRTLDLGDWSRGDAAATQTRFVRSLDGAVRPGEAMSATLDTMRANGFGCNPVSRRQGAESPAQICERQFLQSGCTHTWQVLLFGDARLSEARAGYDRLCPERDRPGGGLLGAPPG